MYIFIVIVINVVNNVVDIVIIDVEIMTFFSTTDLRDNNIQK